MRPPLHHLGRRLLIALPALWLALFFFVPLLVVLKISVAESVLARPPYTPMSLWDGFALTVRFDFSSYAWIFDDFVYLFAYLSSLKIAAISSLLTLIVGYPMAYAMARAQTKVRNFLLLLVVVPFWISFLLRVYAWIGILKANGPINNALMALGLIDKPIAFLHGDFAVYLGMVYTYLPFMVLPLYARLSNLGRTLREASSDLGARPTVTFLTVTLPLSMPGVIAGLILVFVPATGELVIPALLGGPDTLMISKLLWSEFFDNHDWPVASAIAIILVAVVLLPAAYLRKVHR